MGLRSSGQRQKTKQGTTELALETSRKEQRTKENWQEAAFSALISEAAEASEASLTLADQRERKKSVAP